MLLKCNMKEVEIVKFDNNGRGIGYLDGKIIFVSKAIPGDIVHVDVTLEKKNYLEGKVLNYIKVSDKRITPVCPFFFECGGCQLMDISYKYSLDYKLSKINNILNGFYKVKEIIPSNNVFNYRNKVSLKIANGLVGFYENETHNIISINECLICNNNINNVIKDIHLLNINNGLITIRCNYKDELLLIIDTLDNIDINNIINKYNIVGIVLNNKTIYGVDYFIDKIGDLEYKISYDSFFQVNRYICEKLINLIKDYTKESNNILDYYCGVGTLGISTNKKVLGVEIVENAVNNAIDNVILNKKDNIKFVCKDTKDAIDVITNEFDTIILDPPRSGVDKMVINKIIESKIDKIIYVSCNPITLKRDLDLLKGFYNINNIVALDMFPNTEHIECICHLERK